MSYINKLLNGKEISLKIRTNLSYQIKKILKNGHREPGLATIMVGDNAASEIYVRNKILAAKKTGIKTFKYCLDINTSENSLLDLIGELNNSYFIDAILVQLPLPDHIDVAKVQQAISPQKDVDGFHPQNVAALTLERPKIIPCTPKGCLELLNYAKIPVEGAHVVIVGRSNIVGKPMSTLMMSKDATVTVCHLKTKNLQQYTKMADILILAAGDPLFFGADHIKDDAVVIDIGINRLENGKIVGDCKTDEVIKKASLITPVPGGVGPMTIAMLLDNTFQIYKSRLGVK